MPFPLPDGVSVRYVDRLTVEAHLALFPELVGNRFPSIDVLADFDRALPFADGTADFVICSHVIEHVADPFGMLDEIRRVLRPGGRAVVVVPNRLTSFDQGRPGTTLEHLVAERGVTRVDDAHVVEFLETVAPFWAGTPLAEWHRYPADRAHIEWHRARSVHAHCWTVDEFVPLLAGWRIVERVESEPEFGFVLEG